MKEEQIRHSMISVRDKYIEIIRSELLGPGSEFDIPDKEQSAQQIYYRNIIS